MLLYRIMFSEKLFAKRIFMAASGSQLAINHGGVLQVSPN